MNFLRKPLLLWITPVVIICITLVYLFVSAANNLKNQKLAGLSLAAHDEIYPVVAFQEGALKLDKQKFLKAIDFVERNPFETRIAADLIYLGQSNQIEGQLSSEELKRYHNLISKDFFKKYKGTEQHRDAIISQYAQIVDGIGKTFSGTPIEVVLHDTRDPIHSIAAIQNPISGRIVGGPNTNFGLSLIKSYAKSPDRVVTNFTSYPLELSDGRRLKSSTIPIYQENIGLVTFICINMDATTMQRAANKELLSNLTATRENSGIEEIIRASKAK